MTTGKTERTTRTTETSPVAPRETKADAAPIGNHERRPTPPMVVESDDHEEAGYGHGV